VAKKYAHHHVKVGRDDVYDSESFDLWFSSVFFNHCIYYVFPSVEHDGVLQCKVEYLCSEGEHAVGKFCSGVVF
jgi:hypothetical protein